MRPIMSNRFSGRMSSVIVFAASAVAAVVAAAALAQGRVEVAIVITGALMAGAAYSLLTFEWWCYLLLLTAVAARGIVDIMGLPQAFNFVHYPLAAGLALAALARPNHDAARRAARWLVAVIALGGLSAAMAGSHPLRGALFLLIAGEPLLVLWAITRWRPEADAVRRLGWAVVILMAIQIPLGLYQGLTLGWFDPVLGTLTGHGAGAHVLGGLFALSAFAVLAGIVADRIRLYVGAPAVAACFGMIVASGSMAVLVLSVLVIALFPLWGGTRSTSSGGEATGRKRSVLGGLLIGILVAGGAASLGAAMIPGIYSRIPELLSFEELAERRMVAERAESDRIALLFGSGPGTSASRASILLAAPKEESPVAALGLPPTELGYEIYASTRDEFGGSAEAAASGALAIIGDLGLIGFAAFTLFFLQMWRLLSRSDGWLAPAAKAGLLIVSGLIFLDNWLEYPEFALPFSMLLAIALSTSLRLEQHPGAHRPRGLRQS